MSEDGGLDSDSSGREFRMRVARHRSRQAKEARVGYGSKTTMSLQDPMPEYIDPELVKLIAQNAPFELDVFVRSLHKSPKRRAENGGLRKGALKEGERRPQAVEAVLSSVAERNDHLSARKCSQDVRQSCPERIWSDYYEKEENICRAKRKRPKGLDNYRLPPADRPLPNEVSLSTSDNKGIRELRGASPEKRVTSVDSSDEGSSWLEDGLAQLKDDKFDVPSARALQADGNDGDIRNAKPWRHGMRKCTRSVKDEKAPDPICCKRKAEVDSKKTTEVRKYIETKMLERRKEQQQLKAEADVALTARKEQQRKLDLHRQAMFQSFIEKGEREIENELHSLSPSVSSYKLSAEPSIVGWQAVGGKGREHTPRPAWVSEYSSLCEPPRAWSSSSGELSIYLPPPATPPQLEVVPLGLYATQFQYAEGRPSTLRVDGIQARDAQAKEKRRSKRVKGCSREVHRQLKYRKSQITKEFLHNDSPVTRKARWKGKAKPRGRKLSSEEVLQLLEPDETYLPRRSGDLEPYKRSLKRQFHSNGGSPPAPATRTQNSTSRFLPKTPTKFVRPPESCSRSPCKDQVRPISKVKRLKPTQQFVPCKAKELTGEELATLLNLNRVPSDRESETNVTVSGKVVAKRMVTRTSPTSPASEQESSTDLRKCVGHSLGSPQQNITDEDVLCKWLGPSLKHSEKHLIEEDVPQESRGDLVGSVQPSRNKGIQLQVVHLQNEKTGDTDVRRATSQDSPLAVRWQRMQLLKNLAEQLVRRVDEACAKKHRIERSAVEKIDSPSMDIDSEPSEQLAEAESRHAVDSLEAEPILDHLVKLNNCPPPYIREPALEFFQPKQNSILHCRELTEQEQAGCDTPPMQLDEVQFKIKQSIARRRSGSMSEIADQKVAAGPVSEMCTMMDWNTSEKGSSSPSTGSSSPVILPTNARFHMGRIKHSKIVVNEEKAHQAKKEDWIIPPENDTYSIFNVYTQHLKDRGKLATRTSPCDLQNDLENRTAGEMEIDPGIAGPAAQEEKSSIATIPLSQKLTISELPVGMPELMSVQTVQSAGCSHKNTVFPESDGTGPDIERNQNVFSSNFESVQNLGLGSEKSALRPGAELNNLKTDGVELAGVNPEVTILEIGDLKLCQSPTSFHLRLDRCKDIREDGKAREQKPMNVSHLPNVGNCTEPSSNTCVGSRQETRELCVGNLIPPMKITYARRVNSKVRPGGGCTDDERVVVELHQMKAEGPPVPFQGETRLDCPDLDASEEAPTSSQRNNVVGNAQSQNLEEGAMKLSTINGDFNEGYMFSNTKGNLALRPTIDRVSDHDKLGAFEGEIGSPSCQKGKLTVEASHNSKCDLQIDLRDSQEWELKLRRDQLEAELQKLDAEIMKTRARLHQRHSVIDRQAHTVSMSSLADQPAESPFKSDKASMQSTKHMADKQRDTVIFDISSDLQTQNVATSHLVPIPRRDGMKTLAGSDSYSDSFVSEDTESEQKIPGTGKFDFTDRPQSRITASLCDKSLASTTGIQQFEAVLDRPRSNQRNAEKKQAEAQSNWKIPGAQDDYPSEGSEISTGRGPGRRLDKPPHVDGEESTARSRTPKVRSIPVISGQMVETDVGDVETCAKDERNVLESLTSCIRDGLRGAIQDSVITTHSSGRAPIDSIPQQLEEKTSRDKGQVPLQQNGGIFGERRKSHALPECGTGEGLSPVDQCRSRNVENSKRPTTVERNINLSVTACGEIPTVNRASPCIQQNGWPMKGKEGYGASFDTAEVLSSSISEQKEGRISHGAVSSTTRALENGSGGGSARGVGKVSQTNGKQVATIRNAGASIQNAKTLLSAEDSHSIVAAEEQSCPPHPMGDGEECIPAVPRSSPCVSDASQSPMENPAQNFSDGNIVYSKEGNGQTKTFDGRKGLTCSHDDKPSGDVATTVPHFVPPASLTLANIPCGTTTKETDWECLSLLSHLDFSTIKEKLRNNKLAGDEQSITDDRANYQSKMLKSPSSSPFSTRGDSFGGQAVASDRTFASDVPHNSKSMHENSGSPSTSNIGGDSSEGQILARERVDASDFPYNSNKIHEDSSPPSSMAGGDSSGEQTVVNERIVGSDVPITLQDHENSTSLNTEQTAKSKYPPEMETNQENGFPPVLSHSTSTKNRADPNNQLFDGQGLTMPVSSTTELPRFLPSIYFQQQMTNSNPSEEAESTISEDLENYESDINEDLLDAEGPYSGHFEVVPSWKASSPLPSNAFISTRPDLASSLAVGTPNIQVFHSESGLSVTNGLTVEAGDVFKSLSTDCIDRDETVGISESSGATGPARPSKLSPGQSDNRLSLHTRDQYERLPATCTSPGSGDGEVIGTLQSIRKAITDDSNLREFTRVSDVYYCGSEVSGSQPQSECISEDVHFGDNETSSSRSGYRGIIHRVDLVELTTREDNNEESDTQHSVDDGKDYPCCAISSSAPHKPDFIDSGDRQHSVGIAKFTTTAVTRKDPEDNSFTDPVSTVDSQERARSEDDSQHRAVLLGSHVEPESSGPVELPMSFIIPPVRSSEDTAQCNDSSFSNVARVGKLSAMESQFEETLRNDEEHSLNNVYALEEMESASTRVATWTALNAPPGSVFNPGEMVKPATKLFYCDWDVRGLEDNPILVEKRRDLGVFGLSSHQMRLVETCDADFSVDGARSVDCNSENSLPEELEKTGLESDETGNLSNTFRVADTPSVSETAANIVVDVIESAVPDCSHEISEPPVLGLEKVGHQDEESLLASIPVDCGSHCASTFVARDTADSCPSLTSTSEEKQLPIECRSTRIESNRSFASFHVNTSSGGPSAHQMAPANRDLLSLSETGDTCRPQNISVRHDKITALQFRKANTVISTSPLLGHQQFVIDVVKDAEDKSYSRQINAEYNFTKTTTEIEGHRDKMYSPVCSLEALQTDLRSQHDTMSERPTIGCSSKEGFLSRSAVNTGRTKLPAINIVPKLPRAKDLELSSSVSCSFNELLNSAQENMDKRSSLMYIEEKEELRFCEIHEDAGSVSSKPASSSGVLAEQLISKTCLPTLRAASPCFVTRSAAQPNLCGTIKNTKLQMDADRAEKLNIMADLLTSMVYEDLLSVELCGFHHEAGRTPTSMKTSRETNQTANWTKTFSPKLKKRSRKISEFCQVLKHFLPTGWRSASVRHKTGLFLHVEGLRRHPTNPATSDKPGTLKYPSYPESEHGVRTANNEMRLLDSNDVYTYVQRSFELSSLILDPSPANWYDPKTPVGEHIFVALDSQFSETSHIIENSRWKIQKKLISDLINETLSKQFATKLLVPSLGTKTLPLPPGGESLVQFVANGIVENERYASKHGFDIEKVIAKAFEDEHWEKCSEEAREVVSDLAKDILGDMLERFVYQMVRGWCYYSSERQDVLAS